MKALVMTQYGDIDTSLAFQEIEKPTPDSHEVLIKVHAASVNPIDNKVLAGDFKAIKKIHFPDGIGRDVSGEISAVGPGVTRFSVGDEVFARVDEQHVGTLAEFVKADVDHIALKPSNLTHEQAASIPLVGLTSYQALMDIAQLKVGDKVLIHAGAGGIGSMAIQLAKAYGAFVATTTSTQNVEWVKKLGADVVIDYKKQHYLKVISDYDVVYDTLGGNFTEEAFKVIKSQGRVVSLAGPLDQQTTKELGLNFIIRALLSLKAKKVAMAANSQSALYRMHLMSPNGEQLSTLATLYQAGKIVPIVDKHFEFDDSKKALSYLAKGRAKGKIVISMIPRA